VVQNLDLIVRTWRRRPCLESRHLDALQNALNALIGGYPLDLRLRRKDDPVTQDRGRQISHVVGRDIGAAAQRRKPLPARKSITAARGWLRASGREVPACLE